MRATFLKFSKTLSKIKPKKEKKTKNRDKLFFLDV